MATPIPALPARLPGQPATMVAKEALLLWPSSRGESLPALDQAGPWPVFAMVLDEADTPIDPGARPLLELLEGSNTSRIVVVDGSFKWSILDRPRALLRLAVHASAPVRFDIGIVLPARPVLGVLDELSRGATLAITTRRHASTIADRRHIREALNRLVLLHSAPSTELAALATTLAASSTSWSSAR